MQHVLVLNQNYQAISLCSPERAIVLVFLQKAEMIADLAERKMRSVRKDFPFPSVIRLLSYVHLPYRKVALTRQNVFKRDGGHCVYCGSKENLTLDHVVPRALGGRTSWTNLVTACQKCNTRKADAPDPEAAGMKLLALPYRPCMSEFMILSNRRILCDQMAYLRRSLSKKSRLLN